MEKKSTEMETERFVQVTPCNPEMDKACMEIMQLAARHRNMSLQVKRKHDSMVFTLEMSGKPNLVKEKISTRGVGSKYRRKERRRRQREEASSGYDTDEQHSTAPTSQSGTSNTRRSSVSSVSSDLPTPDSPATTEVLQSSAPEILTDSGVSPSSLASITAQIPPKLQQTNDLDLLPPADQQQGELDLMREEVAAISGLVTEMLRRQELTDHSVRIMESKLKSTLNNEDHYHKLSHGIISKMTARIDKLEEQQVPKKELRKTQHQGWGQQGREKKLQLKRQEIKAAMAKEAFDKDITDIKAALGDNFEHLAATVDAAVAAVAAVKIPAPGNPWNSEHMRAAMDAVMDEIGQAADQMEKKNNFEQKKTILQLKKYFVKKTAYENRSCIDYIFIYV